MVKAGHVGHDGSFIRLGGIDDICGIDREERSRLKEGRQRGWWRWTQAILFVLCLLWLSCNIWMTYDLLLTLVTRLLLPQGQMILHFVLFTLSEVNWKCPHRTWEGQKTPKPLLFYKSLPSASSILGMSRCFSAMSKARFRFPMGSS